MERKGVINLSESFFYLVFVLWLFMEIILNSTIETIMSIPKERINNLNAYIVLVFLMIHIVFFQRYNLREIMLIAVLSTLVIIATINSEYRILLSSWIFIVAAKHIDFDKLIRYSYITLMLSIGIVFALYFMGVIDDSILYRSGEIRHSWGFAHPNNMGAHIFQLVLCHIYVHRNRIRIYDFFIICIAILFEYKVPNCQTAVVALLFLFILMLIYRNCIGSEKRLKIISKYMIFVAVASNILSILMSSIDLTKHKILMAIDLFSSIRFTACHRVLNLYGLSLLGQKLYINQEELKNAGMRLPYTLYLDNSYMAIMMRYGVITYLVFSILFVFGIIYYHKAKKYMIVLLLSVFSIYGIMENAFFSVKGNLFLLSLTIPLYYGMNYVDSYIDAPGRIDKN